MRNLVIASTLLLAGPAFAQDQTVQQEMTFSECLQNLQQAQTNATQAPTVSVDTADKKEVIVPVQTGQLVITCDGVNQRATLTHRR